MQTTNGTTESRLHTGHFEGGTWVLDAPVTTGASVNSIFAKTGGHDGRGFILYGGSGRVFARYFDALDGLGAESRIDDQTLSQGAGVQDVMARDDGDGVTVAMTFISHGCVATRRFDGASWGAATCVNTGMPMTWLPFFDLTTTSSGKAMLVWAGYNHDELHVITRPSGTAQWSAPVSINTAGLSPYVVLARLAESGKAAVGFAGRRTGGVRTPYVSTSDDAQNWTEPVVPGAGQGQPGPKELLQFDLQLDQDGSPGILAFYDAGDHDSIEFNHMSGGSWSATQVLQSNVTLASTVYGTRYILSMNRLVPLSGHRWVSFWELVAPDDGVGRQVVMAVFD
jgi:hypothetical protein